MKTSALAALALAIVTVASAQAGEVPATRDGLWKCQSIQSDPQATLYVSDIFDLNADGAEVQASFKKLLGDKYSYNGAVSCSMAYKGPGILEKLKGDDQRWFSQLRAAGTKVVDTHWVFAAEREKFSYQCWGGAQVQQAGQRKDHFFHADPVELPGDSEAAINEAWIAHLADLHPGWFFAGAQGCQRLPADAAQRQNVIASIMDPWKARGAEIHKLDWKYAPVTKSAADDVPSEFCQALRPDNKVWYVTPVFPMASVDQANVAMNAWRTHLRDIKDADGMVVAESYLSGCDGPGPAKQLRHQRAARAEQIRDAGGQVIETNWVSSSGPAAPSPASAANQTYQCTMTSFGGNYMTNPFSTAKDMSTLLADWRTYITGAHPVQGVVRTDCQQTTPQMATHNLAQTGFTHIDWKD